MRKKVTLFKFSRAVAVTLILALLSTVFMTGTSLAQETERVMKVGERFEVGIDGQWITENPDIVAIERVPCPAFPSGTHDYAVAIAPGIATLRWDQMNEMIKVTVIGGDYKIGDINRDGNIDSTDLTILKRHLLKVEGYVLGVDSMWEADVDGDNSINSTDLTYFKRFLLKTINELPKQNNLYPSPTPTIIPTPTAPSPSPTLPTPSPSPTPTPSQSPSPTPTIDPHKINTVIRPVGEQPLDLVTRYNGDIKTFNVKLTDADGNPLAGKSVKIEGNITRNIEFVEYSSITDSNGEASFTFMQSTINEPYVEYIEQWYASFEGDDEYNQSKCTVDVNISNNGIRDGMQTPIIPSPTPTLLPTPLPSPTLNLDPNKINTVISPVGEKPLSITNDHQYLVGKFSVKLTDEDGNPLVGKTVRWEGYVPR